MNPKPPSQPASDDDGRKVRQVEILISTLLRVGVVVSLLVVLVGVVVTFAHHREYLHSRQELEPLLHPPRHSFPDTVREMIFGVRQFQGRSIVVAGLLLLIATPVLRVAVSVFAFVYERDRVFVVITSIVLALLLLSFFLGKPGG